MLRPTVKRGLMLDFIPQGILYDEFNPNRIYELNNLEPKDGDIYYVISREYRLEDNWGLIFSLQLAKKYNKKLKLIILINTKLCSEVQKSFFNQNLKFFCNQLEQSKIDYEITADVPSKGGAYVFDFNPVLSWQEFANKQDCACYEIDSHNIIPARFVSQKAEFSAANLRRKIYGKIAEFLTEFPKIYNNPPENTPAKTLLTEFISKKLSNYAQDKNDPNKAATSNLSAYLHFGFISAQRIAIEVLKSGASRENKESFLEELIVRKELSDNFCLYTPNFNSFSCAPNWAKETLINHKSDIRTYIYSKEEFEHSRTHEDLWNKIQSNLVKSGKIHGYLRMYWAKKVLEWSKSPEEALDTAIYLNDKYALDGNNPNGYVGILWSICGVHDRPFFNRPVFGKIRYMSLSGCKSKFDVIKYIQE